MSMSPPSRRIDDTEHNMKMALVSRGGAGLCIDVDVSVNDDVDVLLG